MSPQALCTIGFFLALSTGFRSRPLAHLELVTPDRSFANPIVRSASRGQDTYEAVGV